MGLIRSGQTDLTPEYNTKLTEYLWPIVREIVKTAIENEQNLIVEGCYVPFDWEKDFEEPYRISIRFICLAMNDAYIESHYEEILRHSSDIETRLGVMVHTVNRIPGNLPKGAIIEKPLHAVQGRTYGKHCYRGPKPPFNCKHDYRFTVYVLDTTISIDVNSYKKDLLNAMEGHIL